MSDETKTASDRRNEIKEAIQQLAQEYARTWEDADAYEGFGDAIVTAYHMPVEVMLPTGSRVLVEISDSQSSRHTAIGLLYAALNDPRWLDPARLGRG